MTTAIYTPKGAALEYAPLALNLWRGCLHGCLYCFCPAILRMTREEFHAKVTLRQGVLEQLTKDCAKLSAEYVVIPRVHLSFSSDPWPAHVSGGDSEATRLSLIRLGNFGIPVSTLTKAGARAARDLDILATMDAEVGVSLVWHNDAKRAVYEPGAAPIEERIEYLAEAKRRGIKTWASVEPVIEPLEALQVLDDLLPHADVIKVGKLNHSPDAHKIDWRTFAVEVKRRLEAAGKPFMLKKGLAEWAP